MKKISFLLMALLMSFVTFSQNVVYSEGFEEGMGLWTADQNWNKAEVSTTTVKSGSSALEGRRDSDQWSNHGVLANLKETIACFGDGTYKVKFSIFLAEGFDRNIDFKIFKNGDQDDKDYGTVITGIDKTVTGVWQDIEADFTFADLAALTEITFNINTWGGTAYNPGIPFFVDDFEITTENEDGCNQPDPSGDELNVVFEESFEDGLNDWTADETWNVVELSTDMAKTGANSIQGRRDSDQWSNHGLIGSILEEVQCFGDGDYKLTFSIFLADGFDRNTDLTIFKNGDRDNKDYGNAVAGIDKTVTGVWQDIEVDFTFADVAELTDLSINISTWGGTPSNPGIPFYVDDVTIRTSNESTCTEPEEPVLTGNTVILDDFEDGLGVWTADETWNVVELSTDMAKTGSNSIQGRRDSDQWSNHGLIRSFFDEIQCYGDGDYKLTFSIFLAEGFDRNTDLTIFKDGDRDNKDYGNAVTGIDKTLTGEWQTIEVDFTFADVASLTDIAINIGTWGGTPTNPGIPFYIDDLRISTENEKNCPSSEFDGVLVDYSANQIASNSQDDEKVVGDIWARDALNVISLEIIDATEGPAGYSLSEKILKVNAGEYEKWHNGLMFEFESVTVDLESNKYLHVAYYLPKLTSDDDGAIRNWLKGGGVQRWNYKAVDQPGTAGTWVDLVYDISNDSINGLDIDHFEFMGFPRNETSYIGSIILSDSEASRFESISDGILVDYSANQIASNNQDDEKVAGDIWARDANNVIALEIVDATEGPAGYSLSEKILKVEAGEYVNWWDGLMFEFEPVTVDLESAKYLHVAYYLPKLSSDDGGAIRNWLKGGRPKGLQRWKYGDPDQPGTAGTWVDLVYDITNDTINGLSIDHFEFMGFPRSETSYIGSIILSGNAEPRIEVAEPTVPKAPSGLFGEAVSNTEVTLGWTDNSDDETMFIVKLKDGDNWAGVANLEANTTSTTISGLEKNTTYTFVVVALNDVGESEISNEITVSTLNTGIADFASDNMIYPNPVKDRLTISSDVVAKWTVTDLSGKKLMTGSDKKVNAEQLQRGMYIIRIELQSQQMVVNRFIKQ